MREMFDEIPREGGRAVLTVGIIPLLMRADRIRHFLELNEEFALEFGKLGRIVFYLANLYLNLYPAEIGPFARKVMEDAVDSLEDLFVNMTRAGLTSYDAGEQLPTLVAPGDDEDLREVLRLTFDESTAASSGAISRGELLALVTAPTSLLASHCFLADDPEPTYVIPPNLMQSMRYAAAVFRLYFRHSHRMRLEDSERDLIVEYIQQILRDTRKAGDLETVADLMASIRKSKLAQEHREL